MTSQTQRAAVSVRANIAEGRGRHTNGDSLRFLTIAYGSLCELETHLLIAQRTGYLHDSAHRPLVDRAAEVGRLLNGLMHRLR